jgi:hypothetical protein
MDRLQDPSPYSQSLLGVSTKQEKVPSCIQDPSQQLVKGMG